MSSRKPSANEKFYAKQQAEFWRNDRDCDSMHGTRAQLDSLVCMKCGKPVREEHSAYGLSRGSRAVLIDCACWDRKVWFIFESAGVK